MEHQQHHLHQHHHPHRLHRLTSASCPNTHIHGTQTRQKKKKIPNCAHASSLQDYRKMKEKGVLLSPTTAFNPIGAMMLPSAGLGVRPPLPPSPSLSSHLTALRRSLRLETSLRILPHHPFIGCESCDSLAETAPCDGPDVCLCPDSTLFG